MPQPDDLPLAGFYQGRLLNFAHRGAREQAPENTLPAFERAAELGADGVELDVQLSADGVPVVIHDFTLERTTDGSGRVRETPLAALRELDAGVRFSPGFAGTRVPTLDEVFETVGARLLINVEIKSGSLSGSSAAHLAQAVVGVVRRHAMQARVLCSSFNPLALRSLKRLAPVLPAGHLIAPGLLPPSAQHWLAGQVIGEYEARHPHYSIVTQAYMASARRAGRRVNVWTVNDVADIRRIARLGVDAIISDRPDVVRAILQDET